MANISKKTPETIDAILKHAESGAPMNACCKAAGITPKTWDNWCEEDPELEERFAAIRERQRSAVLKDLKAAGARDWRALDAWLLRSFPADYSPKAEIKVDASTKVVVVQMTQERLKVLQEAHQKALGQAVEVLAG